MTSADVLKLKASISQWLTRLQGRKMELFKYPFKFTGQTFYFIEQTNTQSVKWL